MVNALTIVMRLRMILLSALVLTSTAPAIAQNQDRISAYGGYDIDLHNAQFAKITALGYCCPTDFGSVSGATIYGAIGYDVKPLLGLTNLFGLSVGVGYQQRSLSTAFQALTYINDPQTNQGSNASINYTMQLNRSDVFLDVLPRLDLTSALKVMAGVRISLGMASSMNQREELPEELAQRGYYFIDAASQDRLPYRNIYEGGIPDLNTFAIGMTAGITYDLAVNKLGTIILTPGLWYRYQPFGFSSAVTSRTNDPVSGAVIEQKGAWSIQSAGASVALRWLSKPTVKLEPCQEIVNGKIVDVVCPPGTVMRIDPATLACVCDDTLRVDTAIVVINGVYAVREGVRDSQPLKRIDVIRSPKTTYQPLIYAVAFADASSNIDLVNRYIEISTERKQTFQKEKSFPRLYQRHVLNIIGAKYTDGGITSLQIVGFANASETGGDALALERAMKVREHLYRRWGIPLTMFQVRAATAEERSLYAAASNKLGDQRVALIFLNGTSSVIDFIAVEDKYTRVDPSAIVVEATVDLGMSRSVASKEYQLRLGGNTGGKMLQPVRAVINDEQRKPGDASSSWRVALSGRGADIEPSLYGLPVGETAKLIPALRATSTTGQVIEAERNNASSVIPIRVTETGTGQQTANDTVYATVTLLDFPTTSQLYQQQRTALNGLLSSMSLTNAVAQLRPVGDESVIDATTRAGSSDVRMLVESKGARVMESGGDIVTDTDRDDPLGIQRSMQVLIRMPRMKR